MLADAPQTIIDGQGCARFGSYRGAVESSSFDGLKTAPWRVRALGQKRWIYIGVYTKELIAGGCVVDLTYLASAFAYAFDRPRRVLLDHHSMGPRLSQAVPDSPVEGVARFSKPGAKVTVDSSAARGDRRLRVEMGKGPERLVLDLEVQDDGRAVTPLSAVVPLPKGRLNFTHKAAGLLANGTVRLGERTVEVKNALTVVDYTHSLPEHHTSWLWASAAGHSEQGQVVGLNLVQGWREGAHEENAAWLDGRLIKLGPASFARQANTWRVTTDALELRFFAEGERRQDVDLKLIASRYCQPMGRFEGRLIVEGETVLFTGLAGVTEDHTAVW